MSNERVHPKKNIQNIKILTSGNKSSKNWVTNMGHWIFFVIYCLFGICLQQYDK